METLLLGLAAGFLYKPFAQLFFRRISAFDGSPFQRLKAAGAAAAITFYFLRKKIWRASRRNRKLVRMLLMMILGTGPTSNCCLTSTFAFYFLPFFLFFSFLCPFLFAVVVCGIAKEVWLVMMMVVPIMLPVKKFTFFFVPRFVTIPCRCCLLALV